jgi:biotin carboxyl carrier protein
MKMENEIPSEFSGKVVRVYVKKGENVGAEQPLVEIV